jgi:hypothetical protein
MLTSHDLADLRARAATVTQTCALRRPSGSPHLSARAAASALAGIVSLVADQQGMGVMRSTCAKLARLDRWDAVQGDSGLRILAAVVTGLAQVAGAENTRAALAFWACETDPAVWRDIAMAA